MLTIRQFASIPGGTDLTGLYRARVGDYPKFFKMDTACKLGFLLAEQLADEPRFTPRWTRPASWDSSWRSSSRTNRVSRPARTAPC